MSGPGGGDGGGGGGIEMPHDERAERAVLGVLLRRPELMREIGTLIDPEHFYSESNRAIYRAISMLDERNEAIDTLTVTRLLLDTGTLQEAGGAGQVSQLHRDVPSMVNATTYARIVRERAQLRSLITASRETIRAAAGDVESAEELADSVANQFMGLTLSSARRSVVHIAEALKPAIDRAEQLAERNIKGGLTGVRSGFTQLDRMTNGWQPSDLIILAARPGMGKTAFALNMLLNAARGANGTPGVFFSLEMSAEQLAVRLLCSEARVPIEKMRSGDISRTEFNRIFEVLPRVNKMPIYVDDTPSLSAIEMMRKCRQLQHEHGIGMAMVDYLQLMKSTVSSRNASREQEISEISRNLKGLAKELSIPIIALSQLNRSVEKRPDKRPMLSDLRESGAIEQDADIITFLYRDDYYASNNDEEDGPRPELSDNEPSVTELLVAKHRSGATGKALLQFHRPYTLFTNFEPDGPPPPDDDIMVRDATVTYDDGDFDYPPVPPAADEAPAFHATETTAAPNEPQAGNLGEATAAVTGSLLYDDDFDPVIPPPDEDPDSPI